MNKKTNVEFIKKRGNEIMNTELIEVTLCVDDDFFLEYDEISKKLMTLAGNTSGDFIAICKDSDNKTYFNIFIENTSKVPSLKTIFKDYGYCVELIYVGYNSAKEFFDKCKSLYKEQENNKHTLLLDKEYYLKLYHLSGRFYGRKQES